MKKLMILIVFACTCGSMYAQKKHKVQKADLIVPCPGNINQYDPDRDMHNCYITDSTNKVIYTSKTKNGRKRRMTALSDH